MSVAKWYLQVASSGVATLMALFLVGSGGAALSQAIARLKTLAAPFQPIATELQSVVQVPLMLPARLPLSKDDPRLYATVTVRNTTQYEIVLGWTVNCGGGNACRWGTLSGQRITPNTPSIARQFADFPDPNFQPWADLPPEIKQQFGPVKLTRGISGFFVPATCGATCGDSMVLWEQDGFRYMVGIKVGKPKDVIALANSAIENQR